MLLQWKVEQNRNKTRIHTCTRFLNMCQGVKRRKKLITFIIESQFLENDIIGCAIKHIETTFFTAKNNSPPSSFRAI